MIELLFVACLAAAPQECQQRVLTFTHESVTLHVCTMNAQEVLARWVAEQPDWRITRYRCGYAGHSKSS